MTVNASKLTVSVPKDLIVIADEIAKDKNISRSKLITQCLQELAKKHIREQMEEGYRVMAKEQEAVAEISFDLQREVVPKW
jgi:metal-responsive CopG/Arc/MetJ family transcriptional regulator